MEDMPVVHLLGMVQFALEKLGNSKPRPPTKLQATTISSSKEQYELINETTTAFNKHMDS